MEDISKSDFNILNTPDLMNLVRQAKPDSGDLVAKLSQQKLRFKELSFDVILQLLIERQVLRDRNKSKILGEIEDVSSDISCCENLRYSVNSNSREELRLSLTKQKADLETALREEDINLWRDTEELRRIIVDTGRTLDSEKIRAQLLKAVIHDGNKGTHNEENPEYMPGSQA